MNQSPARRWDLPSAVFLFFAILFSLWRLQLTGWTEGLGYVRNTAIWGLVIGLALGASAFKRRGVVLLTIGYMLVVFTWQWFNLIDFAKEDAYLGDRLLILAGRLLLGLSEYVAGRPVKDPLFFIAMLCIPYWFISLISGYQMTRHANALAAILPGGIVMFLVFLLHYTDEDYSWLFGAYLFAAFLFLGRQKYLADKRKWDARRVQIPVESGMDFNNTILASAAVVILLVWLIPSALPYNNAIRKTWNDTSKKWFARNERWENMFASAKQDAVPVNDFYRDTMPLGTYAKQGESIAFLVYTQPSPVEPPRLYWRGRIYDRFEDGRWTTSNTKSATFSPHNNDLEIADAQNRIGFDFTFNMYLSGQTILYAAAQPVWVSHPANILYKTVYEGERQENVSGMAETMDITTMQAVPFLTEGESYHTTSLIANPSADQLRTAGEEYPAWVTDEYLQLPNDFSVRIQSLAFEITADSKTPYDKTAAITEYLRQEIKYIPSVKLPAESVDPLEYFLFDSKQGFCNYYASAEVLMLRSIGVPARLAVGFAQGESNLQNTFYTVRERDAHAWPEVYFPKYGWVEFEPTVNQAALIRPDKNEEPEPIATPEILAPDPIIQEDAPPEPVDSSPAGFFTRTRIILISLAVLGLTLSLFLFLINKSLASNTRAAIAIRSAIESGAWPSPAWLQHWARWLELTSIERAFHSVNTALTWMDKTPNLHATPAERAAMLTELIPAIAPSVNILLREHHADLFTPNAGDSSLARREARKILWRVAYLKMKEFAAR
ncbi:MAG: transglutaminase domain-containing protein [Chloroflexi bacterium]|nr:transglutaminase domain-containing protein [Chloroflexota bacterium]